MLTIHAIENFKFHCKYEKNLNPKTLRAYEIDINQFLEDFFSYKIKEISKSELKEYIEKLYNNNYKIKTIKRKIAVLKAFFNYLEFDELIELNPFRKLRLSLKEPTILPKTLDLKEINPKQHIVVTRQPNTNILAFARYLSDRGVPVWIRHVLVPGLTDFDEHLVKLGEFVKTLKNVDKFEILPYHTMGEFKWRELGIPYPLEGVKPPTADRVKNAKALMHTETYQEYKNRIGVKTLD